jgi:hypothetical protein
VYVKCDWDTESQLRLANSQANAANQYALDSASAELSGSLSVINNCMANLCYANASTGYANCELYEDMVQNPGNWCIDECTIGYNNVMLDASTAYYDFIAPKLYDYNYNSFMCVAKQRLDDATTRATTQNTIDLALDKCSYDTSKALEARDFGLAYDSAVCAKAQADCGCTYGQDSSNPDYWTCVGQATATKLQNDDAYISACRLIAGGYDANGVWISGSAHTTLRNIEDTQTAAAQQAYNTHLATAVSCVDAEAAKWQVASATADAQWNSDYSDALGDLGLCLNSCGG